MNEMKPEDVMRALECCVTADHNLCPYKGDWCCDHNLVKDALALLRRYQAENAEKDAEIERLTAYNANLICANTDITNRHKDYVEEAQRIARADAINEFAERLKSTLIAGGIYPVLVKNSIEKIAKEMKEGSKDA